METIRVSKIKLLNTLEENRSKHLHTYEEAMISYHQAVINGLKKLLSDAKKSNDPASLVTGLNLCRPTNHIESYDKIIGMLRWAHDDEIELSHYEFSQYVEDRWDWSVNFQTVNSRYME